MSPRVRAVSETVSSTYGDMMDVARMAKSAREMARPSFVEARCADMAEEADRVRYAERVARIVHRRAKERSR